MKDGIITKQEYSQLKSEYDRRITEAEASICSCEKEVDMILGSKSSMHEWIGEFKVYRNIQRLERNAAVAMIKKVLIHSADRIEVIYNFDDEFARCCGLVSARGEAPAGKEAV